MHICEECGKTFTGYSGNPNRFCSRSCTDKAKVQDFAERVWSYVDRRGPDDCWPWKGKTVGADGRGRIRKQGGKKAGRVGAPAAVWFLTHGVWPDGFVLHKCDNPPCCNPAHLFIGTHLDNVEDMIRKGRNPRGESNGNAKVTENDVREMRRRRDNGEIIRTIAADYGLSISTAHRIATRRTWKHVE